MAMVKGLAALSFFSLFCTGLCAQTFFVSGGPLYRVTKTANTFSAQQVSGCTSVYNPIAMNGTGLYWLSNGVLSKGTVAGLTMSDCTVAGTPGLSSTALTTGPDGKIYAVSGDLFSFDLQTRVLKNHGRLPFAASGDLTFYNGQLYMTAPQGIVQVDLSDPSKSFVYMSLGAYPNVFNLVTVATADHVNTVYAFSVTNPITNILEIDMENRAVKGIVGTLPFEVYDAASPVEDGSLVDPATDFKINITDVSVSKTCTSASMGRVEVLTAAHPNSAYSYTLDGTTRNSTGVFEPVSPGTHSVTVASAFDEVTRQVTVPDFSSSGPVVSYTKTNVQCDLTGTVQFSLTPADLSYKIRYKTVDYPVDHVFTGLASGEHPFTILDASGCVVAEQAVRLENAAGDCPTLVFPSAFSPNNDGVNDLFRPVKTVLYQSAVLRIFDRWGDQVHTSRDPDQGWNGSFKGVALPQGTYFWTVTLTLSDEVRLLKGQVTLLR